VASLEYKCSYPWQREINFLFNAHNCLLSTGCYIKKKKHVDFCEIQISNSVENKAWLLLQPAEEAETGGHHEIRIPCLRFLLWNVSVSKELNVNRIQF